MGSIGLDISARPEPCPTHFALSKQGFRAAIGIPGVRPASWSIPRQNLYHL